MQRKVSVEYHYLAKKTESYPFPTEDLRTYFSAVGLDLSVKRGEDLDFDPEDQGYVSKQLDWRLRNDRVGHIILGMKYRGAESGILGRLVDFKRRGFCTIYVGYVGRELSDLENFFQTLVHEIGHMLNLGHGHYHHADGADAYSSAMQISSERSLDVRRHWEIVEGEISHLKKSGVQPYLTVPRPMPQLKALPLAYDARVRLNTESDSEILPWGERFRYPDLSPE